MLTILFDGDLGWVIRTSATLICHERGSSSVPRNLDNVFREEGQGFVQMRPFFEVSRERPRTNPLHSYTMIGNKKKHPLHTRCNAFSTPDPENARDCQCPSRRMVLEPWKTGRRGSKKCTEPVQTGEPDCFYQTNNRKPKGLFV